MRTLHINGCAFPLLPGDYRALRRFMPESELVRALGACNDYRVETNEQIQQLWADLEAVKPELLSPNPYKRGEHLERRLEADLFGMLHQAAAHAIAR